jgi:cell division protein FtsZ
MKLALQGIEDLQQYVDTLIVIPNQNLFRIANEKTTFAQAFQLADQVLHSGVRGVTDLILLPGLINLDFADVRSVMSEMGKAMMGTGEGEGDQRANLAAEAAISNPLLDDISLKGARAVLINITGGDDLSLFDVDEATTRIRNDVDPEANIIFGAVFDNTMNGKVRVSVVATGIDGGRPAQISHGSFDHAHHNSAPYELSAKPQAPEKAEPALAAASISQPMFPSAGKTWNTPKAPEPVSNAQRAAAMSPVTAAPPPPAPAVKSPADTVDQLAGHFGLGGSGKTHADTATKKAHDGELLEQTKDKDGSLLGFLGFKRDTAPVTPAAKSPEVKKKEGEEAKSTKTDENFEIPAFLRRTIY